MIASCDQHMKRIDICGVEFTPLTVQELHNYLEAAIRGHLHSLVLHVNVSAINLAQSDREFRDILNAAEVAFCDGFGVRLGAFILGHRTPPRITYADWTWQLAEFASTGGFSIFLLGGRQGVAERACTNLKQRFPDIRIVGTHHGYFDKTPGNAQNIAVLKKINAAQPNVLLVSFGMPVQERWLRDNWQSLEVDVGLTAGAALDYVSGELRRAPKWVTDNGLEWLGRLVIEPRRLWRRYIIGNPVFLVRVVRQRFGSKNLNL